MIKKIMKKTIKITESKLKEIVNESVKKVLNEGRVDSNFITYTQSIRDKVQEYLKPIEEKLGDNIGSEVCNAGHNFIKELNLFIDECYRQEAYKY